MDFQLLRCRHIGPSACYLEAIRKLEISVAISNIYIPIYRGFLGWGGVPENTLGRILKSCSIFLQDALYTGRREQDVRASESWDMDVTSFAVPYDIKTFRSLLEHHNSEI